MTRLFLALPLVFSIACDAESETPAPPAAATPAKVDKPHGDHHTKADAPAAHGHHGDEAKTATTAMYACPMHPDITSDEPGDCSKCGMALKPQEAHDHSKHEHGEAKSAPEPSAH